MWPVVVYTVNSHVNSIPLELNLDGAQEPRLVEGSPFASALPVCLALDLHYRYDLSAPRL